MNEVEKTTGFFKSFDGTQIYYEVRGQGPPIVLAYGIGCLMNHWRHQIRTFSQDYMVISFDYRAHHRSEAPLDRDQLTIDALALDLQCLLEHLEIEKASFWGHSFGAQLLVRCYDMFPQYFHSLVFINGFAKNPLKGMFGSDLTDSVFNIFQQGYHRLPETLSYLWKLGVNNPIAAWLSAVAGGFNISLTSFKDIEVYLRGISSMDLDSFLAMFESMTSYDGRPVLHRIGVPTLIIGGKQDTITPQEHQEEIHQKIKNSDLLMVPYGSHCTQLDMPELVNLKIDQFLHNIHYSK